MIWKAICSVCLKARLNLWRSGQPERFFFTPKGALTHHLTAGQAVVCSGLRLRIARSCRGPVKFTAAHFP